MKKKLKKEDKKDLWARIFRDFSQKDLDDFKKIKSFKNLCPNDGLAHHLKGHCKYCDYVYYGIKRRSLRKGE